MAAATLSTDVLCSSASGPTGSNNPASSSCTTANDSASASASIFSVSTTTSGGNGQYDHSSANASAASSVTFVFTGGAGSGFYVPCMTATSDNGIATFSNSFGRATAVSLNEGSQSSCGLLLQDGLEPYLPFKYNQTQYGDISLVASATSISPNDASAKATFDGFCLFDSSKNLIGFISAASVVVDTPEPTSATLCLTAALCIAGWSRRRKAAR